MTKELRILNLGAGVQSTTIYLLTQEPWFEFQYDLAIFADTRAEPPAVYEHLEYLKQLNYIPIQVVSAGNLEKHVLECSNSTGQRYVSIPAFSLSSGKSRNKLKRQCTSEYKIKPIEQYIRREIAGLKPYQRFPKDFQVRQSFGISMDEIGRSERIWEAYKKKYWAKAVFPLIGLGWTRKRCEAYLKEKLPYECPRSACVFCPFHSNYEWLRMQKEDPESFGRAVEADKALRAGKLDNRRIKDEMFLHPDRISLDLIQFDEKLSLFSGFASECLGMCGN